MRQIVNFTSEMYRELMDGLFFFFWTNSRIDDPLSNYHTLERISTMFDLKQLKHCMIIIPYNVSYQTIT